MFPGFTGLLYVIAALPAAVWGQAYTDVDKLITDLLAGYNTKVRPVNDQSKVVSVNFSLNLFQFTEIDVINGRISLAAMPFLSWHDERISWNPADYGNISNVMLPTNSVWNPNVVCGSPVTQVDVIGSDWMNVRFFPNGVASYTPGDIIDSSCYFDVSYWPFDRQTCNITFLAFGFLGTEVKLRLVSQKVFLDNYVEQGEWKILGSSAVEEFFSGMQYIKVMMQLERRYAFYVMNIVLPIVGIMILNPMVFLLPSESGERIGYSITVLLSIAVFFTIISDNLPTSSAPMAKIIIFILVGLGSSMLISLAVILNLRVYHRTDDTLPRWATGLVRFFTHGTCTKKVRAAYGADDESHTDKDESNGRAGSGKPGKLKDLHRKQLVRCDRRNADEGVANVSWKDVSRAVDTVLFFAFCAVTVLTSIIFVAVLITGDR